VNTSVAIAPFPSSGYVKRVAEQGNTAPISQTLLAATPDQLYLISRSMNGALRAQCVTLGSSGSQGGSAIATGDFDGDGIDDVMVATPTGINAFYGNAYPAGTGPSEAGAP
jgi:hypothetical protein